MNGASKEREGTWMKQRQNELREQQRSGGQKGKWNEVNKLKEGKRNWTLTKGQDGQRYK